MQRTEILTPPAIEPVTLAEAKLHLRVTFSDDDALISALITAARSLCETRLRRALITQTLVSYWDNFPWGGGYYNRLIRQMGPSPYWLPTSTGIMDIPRPPLQSVTSLQWIDYNGTWQTIDPSLYLYSVGTPGRIQPVYGQVWPIARPQIDSIKLTYVAGYGSTEASVPPAIQAAMKLFIGHWYENREQVMSSVGLSLTLLPVPEAADALLSTEDWGGYA